MMLRSLGQNPTDEELRELIDSVDDADDKDGQIQLREFLKLYTEGLDTKTKGRAGKDDVANVYSAFGVRATAVCVALRRVLSAAVSAAAATARALRTDMDAARARTHARACHEDCSGAAIVVRRVHLRVRFSHVCTICAPPLRATRTTPTTRCPRRR